MCFVDLNLHSYKNQIFFFVIGTSNLEVKAFNSEKLKFKASNLLSIKWVLHFYKKGYYPNLIIL